MGNVRVVPDPRLATVSRSHLGRHVGRAHKFMRAWGDQLLEPLGATVTDWILLSHIERAPEPGPSQSELARFSDMASSGMVRYIDRYEDEGLVERRRDADDRRVVRLSLTEAGRARMDEIGGVMVDADDELRSLLSEQEQTILIRALDTLFEFALRHTLGDEASTLDDRRTHPTEQP